MASALRSAIRAGALAVGLLSAHDLIVPATAEFLGQIAFRDFITENSLGWVTLEDGDVDASLAPNQDQGDETRLAFAGVAGAGTAVIKTNRRSLTLGEFFEKVGQISVPGKPRSPQGNKYKQLESPSMSRRTSTCSTTSGGSRTTCSTSTSFGTGTTSPTFSFSSAPTPTLGDVSPGNKASNLAHRITQLPASRFWFPATFHEAGTLLEPVKPGRKDSIEPVDMTEPVEEYDGQMLSYIDPVELSWTIISELLGSEGRTFSGSGSLLEKIPYIVWKMILLPEEHFYMEQGGPSSAYTYSFFQSDLDRTDRALRKRVGARLLIQYLKGEMMDQTKVWLPDRRAKIINLLMRWHEEDEQRVANDLRVARARLAEVKKEVELLFEKGLFSAPTELHQPQLKVAKDRLAEVEKEREFQKLVRKGLYSGTDELHQQSKVAKDLEEILEKELEAYTKAVAQMRAATATARAAGAPSTSLSAKAKAVVAAPPKSGGAATNPGYPSPAAPTSPPSAPTSPSPLASAGNDEEDLSEAVELQLPGLRRRSTPTITSIASSLETDTSTNTVRRTPASTSHQPEQVKKKPFSFSRPVETASTGGASTFLAEEDKTSKTTQEAAQYRRIASRLASRLVPLGQKDDERDEKGEHPSPSSTNAASAAALTTSSRGTYDGDAPQSIVETPTAADHRSASPLRGLRTFRRLPGNYVQHK